MILKFFVISCLIILQYISASNAVFINQRETDFEKKDILSDNDDDSDGYDDENMERFNKRGISSRYDRESVSDASWGRLYVDGFPGQSGIQYFRAHFGSMPPSHRVKFVLAGSSSMTYCNNDSNDNKEKKEEAEEVAKSSTNDNLFDSNTIVVAKRGSCTFVEKAKRAQDAGAGGLLITNNEEGNLYPSLGPGEEGKDLNITIAMISMHHGERLVNALSKLSSNPTGIQGKYVPMTCSTDDADNENYCLAIRDGDEIYVNEIFDEGFHGTISLANRSDSNHTFNYKQAEFGSRIENEETFVVVNGSQVDFCSDIDHRSVDFTDKAVIVPRGSCNFAEKAKNIALMGAKMMLLVNNNDEEFFMGVESNYVGSTIHLAAVMISESSGKEISTLLNTSVGNNGLKLTFHPSSR